MFANSQGSVCSNPKNEFENPSDFEGWNCGKITSCGNHKLCGGYSVKGRGANITKTFMLPAGTYSVELDFIKIDSWFVCAKCHLWSVLLPQATCL